MTQRPVKVTIAYCSECGYEGQTLALAGALMTEFGHALASIELIPWYDGSFEVSVAGQLVHSMMREGGFPEHATIAQAVRAHLHAAEAPA
jgi:selenoprotein W-related protein